MSCAVLVTYFYAKNLLADSEIRIEQGALHSTWTPYCQSFSLQTAWGPSNPCLGAACQACESSDPCGHPRRALCLRWALFFCPPSVSIPPANLLHLPVVLVAREQASPKTMHPWVAPHPGHSSSWGCSPRKNRPMSLTKQLSSQPPTPGFSFSRVQHQGARPCTGASAPAHGGYLTRVCVLHMSDTQKSLQPSVSANVYWC